MNENYVQPDMPQGVEEGIIKGMYLLKEGSKKSKLKVQLLGCGTILREAINAAKLLSQDFGVESDIWSVTSFNELRRDGISITRNNRMTQKNNKPYVSQQLSGRKGPVIAATDYMKLYADQIREFVPSRYVTLGTDGYGRSDTRKQLRHFFEVDAKHIAYAALSALVDEGDLDKKVLKDAIKKYGINPEKPNPVIV